MLDVIVLVAMAVTAVAVAAGLTLQAGLPLLPVLIATAALFLVMSASFIRLGRPARGGGGDRVDELEEALEIIDADLQRIDRVEDDVARLDLLADRVERLDQALSEYVPGGTAGGQARAEELATEFENVYARIEALRADMEAEARSQSNRMASDVAALERVVKRLTGDTTATFTAAKNEPAPAPEVPPAPPVLEVEEIVEEIEVEIEEPLALETGGEPPAETGAEPEPEVSFEPAIAGPIDMDDVANAVDDVADEVAEEPAAAEPLAASLFDDDEDDDKMRDTIRKAVERGRVDLYLQPTVTLPDRKVRYFEALTRVRTADDTLVLPGDYVPVAKRAGMMPLIDNVLLVRSVQALRQLAPDSKVKGVFCNVSMHSLLDPDYFPELVEFMEENSGLSEKLIFEISQPELLGLTEAELGCLDTLGALGYTFCLDGVSDLGADFAGLSDRYFRYVKVSAALFLGGPGRTAAELKQDLDGLGMQLIIEKVEDEGDVGDLLDHGIEFAQGHLFSVPKPSDEALSRARESAGAI